MSSSRERPPPKELTTGEGVKVVVREPQPWAREPAREPPPRLPRVVIQPPGDPTKGEEPFARVSVEPPKDPSQPAPRPPRPETDLDRRVRKLAEEHGELILSVLKRRGCGAAAEDLRQNVLWILADRLEREPPLQNVAGYVARVADNQARNYKALREHDVEREPDERSEASSDPDPEVAAARAEQWKRLFRYIEKLPEEQRRLIRWLDFEGLTLDDVAQLLDRPRSTIAYDHKRARQALWELRCRSDEETESGRRIKPPR